MGSGTETRCDVRASVIIGGSCLAILIGNAPAIIAEETANASPLCEHRSAAHIAEHGGIKADNTWHVAHGDLPTCDNEDRGSVQNPGPRNEDNNSDERKSRYCRQHWYC